jgi:tetratricopeptide (TPR) repeat protein
MTRALWNLNSFTENYKKAISCADEVLKLEANNIKALYRRAAANKELKKYPAAAKDLKFVVERDPGNKPAVQLLDQVSENVLGNELEC